MYTNKIIQSLLLSATVLFGTCASANTVISPSLSEDSLAEIGGVLDTIYGLDNLIRIDDINDQYWMANLDDGDIEATVVEKLAAFKHSFGTIDGSDAFTDEITLKFADNQQTTIDLDPGEQFRFGLEVNNGAYFWSSVEQDNPDLLDHMVTWQYIGGRSREPVYVIAFEDLPLMRTDRDYQDLIIQISGATPIMIPIPGSMVLLLSALGLMVVRPVRKV